MSISLLSAAWDLAIPSTEKMVLMCLCDHANEDGKCWPSVATLCRKTSKGERTVQGALKWLEAEDYFRRDSRDGTSPIYWLNPRKICAPAKSAPPQDLPQPPQKLRQTPAKSAPKPPKNPQEPKTHTKQAHLLPEDWEPKEFGVGTKSRAVVDGWPPGELEVQLEHFRAHHRGKGNRFVDWQDVWSTWVLNSRKWNGGNGQRTQRQQQRTGGGIAAALDRRLGLDEAPGAFGRRDLGDGSGHSALALAAPRPVR